MSTGVPITDRRCRSASQASLAGVQNLATATVAAGQLLVASPGFQGDRVDRSVEERLEGSVSARSVPRTCSF